MNRYELIPHTADIAFRVSADTLQGLFENAAFALEDILADTSKVLPSESVRIMCSGADYNELLINFLDELHFRFETEGMLFSRVNIVLLDETSLEAVVQGEKYDPARHVIRNVIKAVTWHNLDIARRDGRWEVTVVLDA